MAENFNFTLHIEGPDFALTFEIPPGITLISRDPGSGLQLPYQQISRRHANLICSEDRCQIEDLGSTNGTTVNGEPLVKGLPVTLTNGVIIKIGPCCLTFEQTPVEFPLEAPLPVDEAPFLPDTVLAAPPLPPEIPPPDEPEPSLPLDGSGFFPPGLSTESTRLIQYLPGIYQTDFMERFLALFESILIPIEWTVDNFDLFLDPGTAPKSFLPWLANWYAIVFNPSWDEVQRRAFLKDAHLIYSRRGTRWALSRVLEIYTGKTPEIIEFAAGQEPHTFIVRLPCKANQVNRELVQRLIEMNKPAHTTYALELQK